MLHRIIFNKAGQSIVHTAAAYPSEPASYTIEDLTRSEDDPARTLASGTVNRSALSLTSTGTAGAGEANPARVPLSDTTNAEPGEPFVVVAPDLSFERGTIDAVSASTYLDAERPLIGTYPTGSS
ncbi:MAG: hypothetical protein ACTSX8_10870, partial [Alphaproteobacteria bacterium]